MKLQNNKTSKQRELIIDNNNKEIREKFDQFKKENEVLKSKLSVTEKTSLTLSTNFKNINEKVIEMQRMKQCCRREFMEIVGISSSITNDLLEEYVLLILEKLGGVLETMDIAACHRLGKTKRVIVTLLNRKDSKDILEKKHEFRNIALYNDDGSKNSNSRKIFINHCFCQYYRRAYGLVKGLSNEGLIDSFGIFNGTIKIRESSQSKPFSITHEYDLQF